MSSTADNLRALRPDTTWRSISIMRVVGVGTDPTTVVVTDESAEFVCACVDGYHTRAPGDQVVVGQLPGGTWIVLGKFGAPAGDFPTTADVASLIGDAIFQAVPGRVRVSFGDSDPVSLQPYTQATKTFVRDDGNGDRSIVFVNAIFDGSGSSRSGGPSPSPATVTPSAGSSWLADGTILGDIVQAGPDSGSVWSGAWYFGADIAAAIAGKTVAQMWLRVARAEGYGRNGSVLPHFALHNQAGPGPIPALTDQWTPQRSGQAGLGTALLAAGATQLYEIPASQRVQLATGAATGVGVWADDDFCRYDSASLIINFA